MLSEQLRAARGVSGLAVLAAGCALPCRAEESAGGPPAPQIPAEITIAPGQTLPVWLSVRRNGHEELITFSVDNLPHGVIVDDIGLSGVLLEKGLSERRIFLTCARWVPETDRLCFAIENQAGRQTSRPVMLHVKRKMQK